MKQKLNKLMKGFTLVEVVISIAIFGAASLLSILLVNQGIYMSIKTEEKSFANNYLINIGDLFYSDISLNNINNLTANNEIDNGITYSYFIDENMNVDSASLDSVDQKFIVTFMCNLENKINYDSISFNLLSISEIDKVDSLIEATEYYGVIYHE